MQLICVNATLMTKLRVTLKVLTLLRACIKFTSFWLLISEYLLIEFQINDSCVKHL